MMSQELKNIVLNQINLLRKEITCPICLDLFTEPVSLIICHHTFCLECYKGLFFNKTNPKSVTCPICKRLANRRSYYINEQICSTIELINMYDKFLKSDDKQGLILAEKYDAVKMKQFLDDCMTYKGDGQFECISLSSSLDDSDSAVVSKSNIKVKTNDRSLESKRKSLKTPNRKVKVLNTSKGDDQFECISLSSSLDDSDNAVVRKSNIKVKTNDRSLESKRKSLKTPNRKVKVLNTSKVKRKSVEKRQKKLVENINNYKIDDFDSPDVCQLQEDETKIVKLIEDDIVQNIENEFLNQTKNVLRDDNKNDIKNQQKKNESSYDCNIKSVESNSSKKTTTSTGWSRMKTMKKQINKKEVKYKQFNVSINKSKSKSPEDKISKLQPIVVLERVDDEKDLDENQENDIFSMCTQKLRDPPKFQYIENKNCKVDTSSKSSEIDNEIEFLVNAQVHHSSTPVKILKEEIFIDRQKHTVKENICDVKELPKGKSVGNFKTKKSSEDTDDIISATERTPDSMKQLCTTSRRSLRSTIKRNSDENNPVVEKKSSPKRRKTNNKIKIIEQTINNQNVLDIHKEKNKTVVDEQTIKETTNKNRICAEIIEAQSVIDEQQNINKLDFVRNELKLFSEKEVTLINAIQSSINTVKTVLSQCSNYVNSESLFSESMHSKESKNSKISSLTNDQPKILSDNFHSLPLPSNSRSSVEFYRTAIPCLYKVDNYYKQIISLSKEISDETEIFRNTYNDGKEFESVLSFKYSNPTKNEEVQTENLSCPKCCCIIDFNSVHKSKPIEETTTVCSFRELNDVDNISKIFSNENESQRSKNSNISSKSVNSISSNILTKISSSESELVSSRKVNRQLTFSDDSDNVQKGKFKRIRSPTPESDSESSKSKKSNVNFSKLLYRNDIDICFQSEPSENISLSSGSQTNAEKMKNIVKSYSRILKNKEKDTTSSSQESTSKYISILEKEYKNVQFNEISKPEQTSVKSNFDTAPNTVLDNLLKNMNSSVFENINSETDKIKKNQLVTETEQRNIGNLLDNIDLEEFENDNFEVDKYTKKSEKEQENNLSEQKTEKSIPDILSASMFLNSEMGISKIIDTDKTKSIDITQLNFDKKLAIHNAEERDLDKEVENLTNQEIVIEDSIGSDKDLFGEDSIVESTPQKPVENEIDRSNFALEHLPVPMLDILEPPATVTENLDWIDIAPPPPPGFQDNDQEDEPKLNNPNVSSITPDIFALNPLDKGFFANSTFLSGNTTKQTNKEQTQKNVQNNSVLSENIIPDSITPQKKNQENMSIEKKINIKSNLETNVWKSAKRNLNPIVLAQKDKYSPLQIIVNTNSPKQVISSTPKQQKSILSYMQTSQKENNANNSNKYISRSNTPVKQNLNNKSNTFVPIQENLPIDVCESLVPKKNVPSTENKITLLNDTTKTASEMLKRSVCIACSRLKRDEVIQTISLAQKVKAKYSRDFDKNVTHLIVCVDDRNRIKDHTIKYVLAIAHSSWIVSFAWVKDSIENNCLLPEEPYEVLDLCGRPGPKISRLTRLSDPLFKNFVICCMNPLLSVTKSDLENAIANLGGETPNKPSDLIQQEGKMCLILTEAKETQDFDQYQDWRDTFNVLVVDLEWLSRVVGQYQITSVRPYILCLDKGIDTLGYPFSLIAPVPETPTQMTMTNTNH